MKASSVIIKISLIIILCIIFIGQIESIIDLTSRKSLLGEREKQLSELKNQQEQLKRKVEIVKTPEFVEKEAREKLGMAKTGETIVLLPSSAELTGMDPDSPSPALPIWKQWLRIFL